MNMFWELLEAVLEMYDRFSGIINVGKVKKNTENRMSHLYFNEGSIILGKWSLLLHHLLNMFTS